MDGWTDGDERGVVDSRAWGYGGQKDRGLEGMGV